MSLVFTRRTCVCFCARCQWLIFYSNLCKPLMYMEEFPVQPHELILRNFRILKLIVYGTNFRYVGGSQRPMRSRIGAFS